MKRVLVTGFLPFGEDPINPSGEVARALHGWRMGHVRVLSMVLPVSYGGALQMLLGAVRDLNPQAVLCVGQGKGRFALETLGRNHVGPRADNGGVTFTEGPLVPGEPDIPARLPNPELLMAAVRAAHPAECVLSSNAGDYVCNHTLFHALRATPPQLPLGFLHVPRFHEVDLAVTLRVVKATVEALALHLGA
jgi:pyroglutamyl-peptidase